MPVGPAGGAVPGGRTPARRRPERPRGRAEAAREGGGAAASRVPVRVRRGRGVPGPPRSAPPRPWRRQDDTMDAGGGPLLPDSVLFEIFLYLDHADVLSVGLVCQQWRAVARDEFLWKELFYRYYRVSREVPRHPGAPRG